MTYFNSYNLLLHYQIINFKNNLFLLFMCIYEVYTLFSILNIILSNFSIKNRKEYCYKNHFKKLNIEIKTRASTFVNDMDRSLSMTTKK